MEYIVDIYTNKIKWWMKKYECKEVNGKYGVYYRVKTDLKTAKKICRKATFRKIKAKYYSRQWDRSSNYRKLFFDNYNPPYRCRYCNKLLTENSVTVDHIIPVHQAKTSQHARNLLAIQGISNVNDFRNLAPSCARCNKKKDTSMGIWFIKGIFGKYKWFWFARWCLKIFIIIVILYLIFTYKDNLSLISDTFFKYIMNLFK